MGTYYYLLSQLPGLVYGQKPPMPPEEFRALAAPLLNKDDAALLDALDLYHWTLNPREESSAYSCAENVPRSGSDFVDGWREWERALRLNLAKRRFIKTRREGTFPIEPSVFPVDAVAAAAKAVGETPLEGENIVNKARWNAVEALQGSGYFDRNMVFAYLLKLIILERQASFQAKKGLSEYKSLCASILENAKSGASPAGEPK